MEVYTRGFDKDAEKVIETIWRFSSFSMKMHHRIYKIDHLATLVTKYLSK